MTDSTASTGSSRARLIPGRPALAGVAALACAVALGTALPARVAQAGDLDRAIPAPQTVMPTTTATSETAVFAGGCFWGVQGAFQHVKGVRQALAGYDGGKADTAQYETVSTGTTGHAESVRVTFDPRQVTYGQLLRIFFSVVTDPTQKDEQFPDSGTQYRSEIFATTPDQARVARDYIAQLDGAHVFGAPIATIVGTDTGFYPAEGYHQNYLTLHPDSDYISTYDLPKVAALSKVYPQSYSADPVLVAHPTSS